MWRIIISLTLLSLVAAQSLHFRPHGGAKVNNIICPDKQGTCPDGTTCCLLTSGKYGCCPMPEATCCQDGIHCCPADYKCSKETASCEKGGNTNSWFMLKPSAGTQQTATPVKKVSRAPGRKMVKPVSHKKKVCPGGQTFCDGGKTCCFKDKWHFTCCPFVNGICCHGGEHCCPLGFNCDIKLGKCTKGEEIALPWGHTHDSKNAHEPEPEDTLATADTVACPDGKSYCPDGSTCCLLLSGQYGCCPLAQAVCCSDHLHCCPHGSVCDVEAQTCSQGLNTIPWSSKTLALVKDNSSPDVPVEGSSVLCPDGQAQCPDGSTCCLLQSGQYGCCPMQKAKCCPDKLHCCPSNQVCDTQKGECVNPKGVSMSWLEKLPPTPPAVYTDIVCPDKKTCPAGSTCCQISVGMFGCCPMEKAVCCSDHVHCCPEGSTCDVAAGTCSSNGITVPWVAKSPAQPITDHLTSDGIVCPDQTTCPGGSTCCQISVGLFGCCPMEKAVCCSDHVHCCPEGYTCDVSAGKCSSNGETIPWLAKTAARPIKSEESSPLNNVICPDKTSFCPDQTTCCMLNTGQYGCCPLPDAACCKDGVHCCPTGYTCDTAKGTCDKLTHSIPWAEKFAAEPVSDRAGWVVCPDKASQCPDGETCCKQPTGQYGCCPMPKAVCCSDGAHCCPEGSTCDAAQGTCSSNTNSLVISWSYVRGATPLVLGETHQEPTTITCEDKTTCPDSATCCLMKSGSYGCCPYSKGSCCSDQIHCCPSGFHCDKTGLRCDTVDSSITLTSTMFTRFKPEPPKDRLQGVNIVRCPGGKEQCPDGSTCCKQPSGQYGCCKFDNAVCCSDGVHCCPQGFACDPQSGTCAQSNPLLTKLAATPIPSVKSERPVVPVESDIVGAIVCPDREHQCPDGSTCCKLSTGVWGCCAFPQAVCCNDGIHCCPHGYRCLVKQGQCAFERDAHSNQSLSFLTIATSVTHSNTEPWL